MKALLLSEYKELNVTDFDQPKVGAKDVLVQVKACGICGSDIHGYDGSSGRRIPPLVMGHEAAGVVAEVGEAVTAFKPGDHVTFDSTVSCGECYFCTLFNLRTAAATPVRKECPSSRRYSRREKRTSFAGFPQLRESRLSLAGRHG